MRIAFFLGSPQKKICSIFNAVFNIVKKNFSSKFLHGIPYSNANFSPREFQANRSVTVKVLSLLVRPAGARFKGNAMKQNKILSFFPWFFFRFFLSSFFLFYSYDLEVPLITPNGLFPAND